MNRTLIRWLLLTILLAVGAGAGRLEADIHWRLSVKVIHSDTGAAPTNGGFATTAAFEAHLRQELDAYNELLRRMDRGFQLRYELVHLYDVGEWYDQDARATNTRSDLEREAILHPIRYAYNLDAINVYINNTSSGRGSGFPLCNLIIVGSDNPFGTILHEIGHFFDLCHTMGCGCNGCVDRYDACTSPGSDGFSDTLPDLECWSRDQIATNSYGATRLYPTLDAAGRRMVDNVFQNLMSYHDYPTNETRLTRQQWDHIVDISNTTRFRVTDGRTWFIDGSNECGLPDTLRGWIDKGLVRYEDLAFTPFEWGTRESVGQVLDVIDPTVIPQTIPPTTRRFPFCIGGPWKTVAEGVNRARDGEVLNIRGGIYRERLTIRKPLLLTTSHGPVVIGAP
jgi:hypothetical protein